MSEELRDLPPEILAKFLSFIHRVDGEIQVADGPGLTDFLFEYGKKYPVLCTMLKVNEEAAQEYFERTGKVPAGLKLIKTTTQANLTKLEVLCGEDDEESDK